MRKAEEIKHLLEVARRMKFDKTFPITASEVIEFITSHFEFGFVCGALWQKQQDQSTIKLAEDHAMLAGMEKMKEQMTAKAVVTTFNVSLPCGVYDKLEAKGCKEGDRLLVIKEDCL